jgi:nitric oxide reductase NorQ protein
MHEAPFHRGGSTPKPLNGISAQATTSDFIPQPGADFVATEAVEELTNRALAYIEIGYAVHLSGPAGTGKTTLALHIASRIGRRCTLLHGDDELRGSDLLGKDAGYRRQSVRDNYVSSILKTEETVSLMWSNNRLTTACEQGHTVIYDEFTRSPAAANNAFLSILEEGILSIPSSGQDKNFVRVHPEFRAIFTSNPEEYVGVHKSQDALLDRMITLEVSHQDRETEIAIVQAKSSRSPEEVAMIVDIIRSIREKLGGKNGPTIRAALAIARILDHRKAVVSWTDSVFIATCKDVLFYNLMRQSSKPITSQDLETLIRTTLSTGPYRPLQDSKSPSLNRNGVSSSKDIVRKELEPSHRIDASLDLLSKSLEGGSAGRVTDVAVVALAAKNDAVRSISEKKADAIDCTDKVIENDTDRDNTSRRLPRPPVFEASGLHVTTAVSN